MDYMVNNGYNWWEEWLKFKSGEINFKDFMLAESVIKKYRNSKIKDKNDLFSIMDSFNTNEFRVKYNKNNLIDSTIFKKFSSQFATLIISTETFNQIKREKGEDLENDPKARDTMLRDGKFLNVIVVNQSYERVTVIDEDHTNMIDYKTLDKKTDLGRIADTIEKMFLNKMI